MRWSFRIGDFYETFGKDAVESFEILELPYQKADG